MKKKIAVFIACLSVGAASAQNENGDNRLANIDWAEDSVEITTIDDIIKTQQEVSSRNSSVKHFEDVWSRRGYVNLSYSTATLSPKGSMPTGVKDINGGLVPDFKSDWGFSIQRGTSYRLHKKPIANTAQFNIDWTYIDFGINHFKAEGNGRNLYNSKERTASEAGDSVYYIPWNLQKYEGSFGMSLGPSLTIAPFNYVNSKQLHFLRFNVYYHVGYHISGILMPNKKEADINEKGSDHDTMAENSKILWGHGLTQSFGISLSWKVIGLGYEHRSAKAKYKPISSSDFGKDSHEFTSAANRIYIQFRM